LLLLLFEGEVADADLVDGLLNPDLLLDDSDDSLADS
jgi:hypothetical protein